MATFDELRIVKRKYSADLLKRSGVNGVDIDINSSGEASLVVHLDTQDLKIRNALPTELDGHPVKYVYTGPVRK